MQNPLELKTDLTYPLWILGAKLLFFERAASVLMMVVAFLVLFACLLAHLLACFLLLLTGQELAVWTRLTSNSWRLTCLWLPIAGLKGTQVFFNTKPFLQLLKLFHKISCIGHQQLIIYLKYINWGNRVHEAK